MATEKTQLTTSGSAAVYNAIIDETNKETQKLVGDMQALKEAMTIVHDQIDKQGEVLVTVENNVSQADVFVDEGTTEIQVADEYSTSARKKILLIVIIVIILLAGLIIGLLFAFKVL